jgi:hypothetical protein
MVSICSTYVYINNACILPSVCIYGFCMILGVNSDYVPKQH